MELESLQVHNFKPGDVLFIKAPVHTSQHNLEMMRAAVKSSLPEGIKFMIVSDDITLEVVSQTKESNNGS